MFNLPAVRNTGMPMMKKKNISNHSIIVMMLKPMKRPAKKFLQLSCFVVGLVRFNLK
jgi:hypothetical protein